MIIINSNFACDLNKYFTINKNLFIKDELHIDTSIRANFIDTSKFIEAVLDVDRDKAIVEVSKMVDLGYEIKICRDFEKIKSRIKDMKQDFSPIMGVLETIHWKNYFNIIDIPEENFNIKVVRGNKFFGN